MTNYNVSGAAVAALGPVLTDHGYDATEAAAGVLRLNGVTLDPIEFAGVLADLASEHDLDGQLTIAAVSDEVVQPARRQIEKSVVQERVNAIGKWDALVDVIMPAGRPSIFYARWFAPNHPKVFADDPGLLDRLRDAGCTDAEVAAITAP